MTLILQKLLKNPCDISFGRYRGNEYHHPSQTISSHCLVESKFLKLQQHTVRLDNSIIDDWLWIDYHDRINVLVEADDDHHYWVFRQSKYALEGRTSYSIVGGIIEPGEDPSHAATREVSEEMRLSCQQFVSLGRYRTDVNRGMGWTHTFLAKGCRRQQSVKHDASNDEVGGLDTERQDLQKLSREKVRTALLNGEFLEIQWSATVALSLLHSAG